jgi:hypothetical protein
MYAKRLVAAILLWRGIGSALDCPQIKPTRVPEWSDILSNRFSNTGSPGTSFLFSGLQANPRAQGESLPFTVETPPSATGAYDTHTFPAGPVYYSNSSAASIGCLPGIDPTQPNGCPYGQAGEGCLSNGDCTGRPILRTPAAGIQSTFARGVTGITYLGTFEGTSNAAPGQVLQVVFFHQNADYLEGTEYGFYRDVSVPNQIVYYWQTNANCTLRPNMGPNDTMCTTQRANRQPSTYLYTDDLIPPGTSRDITTFCTIDLSSAGGFGRYYYSMWIFPDEGSWKFGMSILDPNTFKPIVPPTSIDPNTGTSGAWFPIAEITRKGGYITAGISRYDPFNTQIFSNPPPAMSVERLMVGRGFALPLAFRPASRRED